MYAYCYVAESLHNIVEIAFVDFHVMLIMPAPWHFLFVIATNCQPLAHNQLLPLT